MRVKEDAVSLFARTEGAILAIKLDIEQSLPGLRRVYAMRLASEQHKKAWQQAEEGLKRATEIHRRLCDLARQLAALSGAVTLTEAECALFAYIKDRDRTLPDFKLDAPA